MRQTLIIIALIFLALMTVFFLLGPILADRFSNKVRDQAPVPVSQAARQLHKKLFIADLHCDVLLWNRNILRRSSHGHVDIPRLLEGNVGLQFFTVVSKVPLGLNLQRNKGTTDMITLLAISQRWPVSTWTSLKQRALFQSQKLHEFAAHSGGSLSIIKSGTDLEQYLRHKQQEPDVTAGVLGIEGAQVLEGELSSLDDLFDAGFRMLAPTHFFDTAVAGSAHGVNKGGLTPFGAEVVRKMEEKGMIVDLAHASPQTIDDVLDIVSKPVVVSHTGVKGTCDNIRNISDEHVIGIAKTGGVIGIGFWPQAVCGADAQAIVAAMKHVVNLVGVQHVALGSDFDGAVTTPFDATGLVNITSGLLEAGFSQEDMAKIMGENVLRVMRTCLPD